MHRSSLYLCSILALALLAVATQPFDPETCTRKVRDYINSGQLVNKTLSNTLDNTVYLCWRSNDSCIGVQRKTIIYNNYTGEQGTEGNTYWVEVSVCQNICGDGWQKLEPQTFVTRITAWLLPVFLLIGNMSLADLGVLKVLGIMVHVLGDPIDSVWSLLTTLELRRRGCMWALRRDYDARTARATAELVAVMDEVGGGGSVSSKVLLRRLEQYSDHWGFAAAAVEAAEEVQDSRANDTRRTMLAIVIYLGNILTAFLSAYKFQAEKPGNRIAYAVLFVWLVPATIISAYAGKASSMDSFLRIIKRFEARLTTADERRLSWGLADRLQRQDSLYLDATDSPKRRSLWSGAVYTFRPSKTLFKSDSGDSYRQPSILLIIAIFPVLCSACIAVTISWISPENGFKCKTLSQVLMAVTWFVSASLTSISWGTIRDRKWATGFILFKDTLVSILAILIVVLSTIGAWTTCRCNSAKFFVSLGKAGMQLDVNHRRQELLKSRYPAFVGINLGALLVMTIFCLWLVAVPRLETEENKDRAIGEEVEDGSKQYMLQ